MQFDEELKINSIIKKKYEKEIKEKENNLTNVKLDMQIIKDYIGRIVNTNFNIDSTCDKFYDEILIDRYKSDDLEEIISNLNYFKKLKI